MKKITLFVVAALVLLGQAYTQTAQKIKPVKTQAMKQLEQTTHYLTENLKAGKHTAIAKGALAKAATGN